MVVSLNTFLFADLCDYTQFTLAHGDVRSAELAVGFQQMVRELAYYESCEVVHAHGDGVTVRASEPGRAVRLAEQIIEAGGRRGYPPVRVGMDTGPAVRSAGDWYGNTVNTAARVAEAAAPDEILMTERTRAALGSQGGLKLVERGTYALKGLPESLLHANAAVALVA